MFERRGHAGRERFSMVSAGPRNTDGQGEVAHRQLGNFRVGPVGLVDVGSGESCQCRVF